MSRIIDLLLDEYKNEFLELNKNELISLMNDDINLGFKRYVPYTFAESEYHRIKEEFRYLNSKEFLRCFKELTEEYRKIIPEKYPLTKKDFFTRWMYENKSANPIVSKEIRNFHYDLAEDEKYEQDYDRFGAKRDSEPSTQQLESEEEMITELMY